MAHALDPAAPARAGITAARIALEEVRCRLEDRESFLLETTLADRNRHLGLVARAKERGYRVWLLYVGLETAGLHLQRVAERVRLGGHDVPDADVLRRLERSLANLPETLRRVDRALVYDNSGTELRLVASLEGGTTRRTAGEGWWTAALEAVGPTPPGPAAP